MMLATTLNAERVIVQGQKRLGITGLHIVISLVSQLTLSLYTI